MSYLEDCTRVCTRVGAKAHLLSPLTSPNQGYPIALCGRQPEFGDSWRGTGSQLEHEYVASLELCKRCHERAEAA